MKKRRRFERNNELHSEKERHKENGFTVLNCAFYTIKNDTLGEIIVQCLKNDMKSELIMKILHDDCAEFH